MKIYESIKKFLEGKEVYCVVEYAWYCETRIVSIHLTEEEAINSLSSRDRENLNFNRNRDWSRVNGGWDYRDVVKYSASELFNIFLEQDREEIHENVLQNEADKITKRGNAEIYSQGYIEGHKVGFSHCKELIMTKFNGMMDEIS